MAAVLPSPSFEDWYEESWPRLVAAVRFETGSRAEAEDAVAEACLGLYQRWDRGEVRQPDAWAYRVAVNSARRTARVAQRLITRAAPSPIAGPDEITIDPDLWSAVHGLPRRQRQAVILRYVFDLTQADAAAVLGVKEGTVATLLHRARLRLATEEIR